MKLLRAKKKERKKAVENAKGQMRKLMQNDPYISKDNLVIQTGLSEYIINEIYMKLRRENIKKAV